MGDKNSLTKQNDYKSQTYSNSENYVGLHLRIENYTSRRYRDRIKYSNHQITKRPEIITVQLFENNEFKNLTKGSAR